MSCPRQVKSNIGISTFEGSCDCGLAFAVFLFVVVLNISLSEGQKTASFEAVAVSAVYLMNWSRAFIWWEQYKLGHTWSLAMEE
jgi:hypothetical protein